MDEEVPTREEMIEALSVPSEARQIRVFLKYDDAVIYVRDPQRARILKQSDDTMVRTQAIMQGKKPSDPFMLRKYPHIEGSGSTDAKRQKMKSGA